MNKLNYLLMLLIFAAGLSTNAAADETKKSKKAIVPDYLGWQTEGQQIVIEDGKVKYEKKQQQIKCWIDEDGKKYYSNTNPTGNKSVKPCP